MCIRDRSSSHVQHTLLVGESPKVKQWRYYLVTVSPIQALAVKIAILPGLVSSFWRVKSCLLACCACSPVVHSFLLPPQCLFCTFDSRRLAVIKRLYSRDREGLIENWAWCHCQHTGLYKLWKSHSVIKCLDYCD